MRIAIIGTGNVGCTLAADLSKKGHEIVLVKSSRTYKSPNYDYIKEKGEVHVKDPYLGDYCARFECRDSSDYQSIIPWSDVVVVTVQTNYHEDVIKGICDYLKEDQVVVFEPGYLSTSYLLKYCDKSVISVEGESSPIDCRFVGDGLIQVLFKNVLNPFGVYPKSKQNIAEDVLKSMGYPYRITESVFEAALHNPNLIVHTVGAMFSIPRIEYTKGNYWMYKEVFTRSVWKVCEALDNEKLEVLSALGVTQQQTYVQACKERNYVNDERDPLDCFYDYAQNSSPKGPSVVDSRYLTEDVSQGLVLLESLGTYFGTSTPVCSSLITITQKALGMDFRKVGRTVDKLGGDNLRIIYNDSLMA